MQQMANPAQPTEAHLALTSILTGLLLTLHVAHFFTATVSCGLRYGSAFGDIPIVAGKREQQ